MPPVSEILDMTKAARMKRAADQGFDTGRRMFHGTADDVAQFSPLHYGRSTGAKSARQGTWLVDDGKTARGYADYAAMDAKVKKLVDKSQRLERQGKWDAANDAIVEAERLESEFYNNRLQGQNIMPLYAKGKYLEKDFGGAEFIDVEDEIHDLIKQAKREGYDGIRAHNLADDVALNGRPATHQLVFDPQNIRSENAAFDPANIGKNDLLGRADPALLALLGGGVGSAAALKAFAGDRPMPGQYSAMDALKGAPDAAMDAFSGMISPTLTAFPKVVDYLSGYTADQMERRNAAREEKLNYEPRTRMGRDLSEAGQRGLESLIQGMMSTPIGAMQHPMGMPIMSALEAFQGMPTRERMALEGLIDTMDVVTPW